MERQRADHRASSNGNRRSRLYSQGVKLYLDDPYRREFEAEVLATADGWCTLSETAFYPGGGGQPCDRGQLAVSDRVVAVSAVRAGEDGRIWHCAACEGGERVRGTLDWPFRYALMRAHALMHIVNTVARDRFGGAITGVQLGPDRSRIDFKLPDFARERIGELETEVNGIVERGLAISSSTISEQEYGERPELIRTLNVLPPIEDGRVRIVTIAGFDSQACGGTHVHSTAEIGRVRVAKFDNKGKENKRFYWEMTG
jgi:misacylated tRNA(Ala) deacylase